MGSRLFRQQLTWHGLRMSDDTALRRTLPQRLVRPARLAWGALVVLATLGGVLGLFQILAGNASSPRDTRQLVATMVAEGRIEADQAEAMIDLFEGTDGGQAALAEAVESGSDTELEAFALLAAPSTRQRGLDLLEAAATTADEFHRVSQLAGRTDPELSLRSARDAVARAPSNLMYLTQLAQAQIVSGDFNSALRTAAAVQAIADTPGEVLASEMLESSIAITRFDKEAMGRRMDALSRALDAYMEDPAFKLPDAPVDTVEARHLPHIRAGEAQDRLADMARITEDWDTVLERAQEALALYEAVLPQVPDRTAVALRRRMAALHDTRALAMHRLDRIATHHEAHEKAIALLIEIAEAQSGPEAAAIETDVTRRQRQLALEYGWLGEDALGRDRIGVALLRQQALVSAYPDEWSYAHVLSEMKTTQALLDDDWEAADDSVRETLEALGEAMRVRGPDEERLRAALSAVRNRIYHGEHLGEERDTVVPAHTVLQRMLDGLERRHGTSPLIEEYRVHRLIELAGDHMRLDNEAMAREVVTDALAAADGLPEGNEAAASSQLHAVYVLAQLGEPEERVRHAEAGLRRVEALAEADQLTSRLQSYRSEFERIIREGGAPDEN